MTACSALPRRAKDNASEPERVSTESFCCQGGGGRGEWAEGGVAAAALNTNDYYVQPVSGQLEIQSTLRILDGAKVCLQRQRGREREGGRGREGKVKREGTTRLTLAVIFTLR